MVNRVDKFLIRIADGILLTLGSAMVATAIATSMVVGDFITRRMNETSKNDRAK